ncbi:hypothetical protein G3N59_12815 [Paraburkholderia sp. Ac-20340]|uniref:hypothetical protein n=1 Tax=Paraburkholderia sp. Ac-20340 TaxID=2703888 RepID=UPI00197CFA93|nr:hypothetical protein [Paraburkholderia sp. Ac-20340]MBN3854266.1 hypothetical protein [Paraburkholderia sp. Ac-20340]
MLALKLTLVPLFLLFVSMSGKLWGPRVAGWLAGLPVVAGPILFLLVIEHGDAFGARAATLSLYAILASEAFNFAYAWTCRARPWWLALAAGLCAWFVAACVLSHLPVSWPWALGVALAATCFGQAFLPRSTASASGASGANLTRTDLATRMAAGAALTLAVTAMSARLGPAWSGLLAVFPLLGSVLAVSSHRAQGAPFVIALLRGMVLGRFGFAAFCLVLALGLSHQTSIRVFAEAAIVAMIVQVASARLARLSRAQTIHAAQRNVHTHTATTE